MSHSIRRYTVLLCVTVLILGGCFAGPDSRWKEVPQTPPQAKPAGIFAGLWHGLIAIPALILGIFTDIKIYETNNTGWWYDFAFLIGLGAFSGGGIHISKSSKKKH